MVKRGNRTTRRAWRATLIGGAVAVLATACVTDLNAQFGDETWMMAINDQGVTAGLLERFGARRRVARFHPDRPPVPLADYEGESASVQDINNANEVLGGVTIGSADGGGHSTVVWKENGELIDLRTLIPGADNPGVVILASDLNDHGLVIGTIRGYDPALGVSLDGVFAVNARTGTVYTVPAEPAGGYYYPKAVNNAGVFVGQTSAGPTRWRPQGTAYVREVLPSTNFWLTDINDSGTMAGHSYVPETAAIWRDGASAPEPLPGPDYGANYTTSNAWITNNGTVFVAWSYYGGGAIFERDQMVRWRSPETPAETFLPTEGWLGLYPLSVNNNGAVLGVGLRSDYAERSIKWT